MVRLPQLARMSPVLRGTALILSLAAALPAQASRDRAAPFLQLGDTTEAPRGFVEMCAAAAGPLCADTASPGDPALVTAALATGSRTMPTVTPPAPSWTVDGCAVAAGTILRLPVLRPSGYVQIAAFGTPQDRGQDTGQDTGGWIDATSTCAPVPGNFVVAASVPAAFDAPSVLTPAVPVATPQPRDNRAARADRAMLSRINRYVNTHVWQRSDLDVYRQPEHWTRSGVGKGAAGDCEDIAIEKRLQLIAAGFPADRLSFAVVYSRESGLHTILVARTDAGDVVLDSRSGRVLPWSKIRYRWLAVQSQGDPMTWRAVA